MPKWGYFYWCLLLSSQTANFTTLRNRFDWFFSSLFFPFFWPFAFERLNQGLIRLQNVIGIRIKLIKSHLFLVPFECDRWERKRENDKNRLKTNERISKTKKKTNSIANYIKAKVKIRFVWKCYFVERLLVNGSKQTTTKRTTTTAAAATAEASASTWRPMNGSFEWTLYSFDDSMLISKSHSIAFFTVIQFQDRPTTV